MDWDYYRDVSMNQLRKIQELNRLLDKETDWHRKDYFMKQIQCLEEGINSALDMIEEKDEKFKMFLEDAQYVENKIRELKKLMRGKSLRW